MRRMGLLAIAVSVSFWGAPEASLGQSSTGLSAPDPQTSLPRSGPAAEHLHRGAEASDSDPARLRNGSPSIDIVEPADPVPIARGSVVYPLRWRWSGLPDQAGVAFWLVKEGSGVRLSVGLPHFTAATNRSADFSWKVPFQAVPEGGTEPIVLDPGAYHIEADAFVPGNACLREFPGEPKHFQVRANELLSLEGQPMKLKGVTGFPYLLGGAPDLGTVQAYGGPAWQTRLSFFASARARGENVVRIGVGPGDQDFPDLMGKLDTLVAESAQNGMIALLQNDGGTFEENVPWLRRLATRFRDNPFVWIIPANEINCNTFRSLSIARGNLPPLDKSACGDVSTWAAQTRAYVQTIRGAGFRNPVVIHATNYSFDLRPILGSIPSDPNLILGVHVYPPSASDPPFKAQGPGGESLDVMWGNLATKYPILIDEFGNGMTGIRWVSGFMPYLEDWIARRGGLGVISFYRSGAIPNDAHDMVGAGGQLTPWGKLIEEHSAKMPAAHRAPVEVMPSLMGCNRTTAPTIIGRGRSQTLTLH